MPRLRVVSVSPSATEVVFALGLGDHLVGRSHRCDYPERTSDIPTVTQHDLSPDATTLSLNSLQASLLREGLSAPGLNLEALKAQEPELVLADHNPNHPHRHEDVQQALTDLVGRKVTLVLRKPGDLRRMLDAMAMVAEALNWEDAGRLLVDRVNASLKMLDKRTLPLRPKPRVVALMDIPELRVPGWWVPELIQYAGGLDLLGEHGRAPVSIGPELLREANPDVLLLMATEPLEQMHQRLDAFLTEHDFGQLAAVRRGKVFVVDGVHYFFRPGPRLVQAAQMLAEVFFPDAFPHLYENTAWQRYRPQGKAL